MEENPLSDSDSKLLDAISSATPNNLENTLDKRKAVDSEDISERLSKAQKTQPIQSPAVSHKSLPVTSLVEDSSDFKNKDARYHQHENLAESSEQPKVIVDNTLEPTKIPNQVPIQTYWNYVEEYFRNFTKSDMEFLEAKSEKSEPFIIPPLGKHYVDKWKEENQSLSHKIERSRLLETKNFDTFHVANVDLKSWNEIQCPALTDRILTSLLNERLVDHSDSDSEESRFDSPVGSPTRHHELVDIDERLRRDLRYLGILNDEDIDSNAYEDNEICTALRSLQSQLREQIRVNDFRKELLAEVANEYIAYQEYLHILDELDKQIEQAYIKRVKSLKSKKKKISSRGLSENLIALMERRKQYVDGIGSVFPKEMFSTPTESIYHVPNDSHSFSET